MEFFLKYFRNKRSSKQKYEKRGYFLKMADIGHQQTDRTVNNFLRWFVTEPRTYIKERKKRRQQMPWMRKRDSIIKEHIIH